MKKRIFITTIAIVFFIFSISVAYSINKSIGRCKTELSTVTYCVDTNLPVPLRIVHLSDLHSCLYGAENETLVHMVSVQAPDLILMTGDMMDRSDDTPEVVCQLIEALSEIAPIYYSYGNHEYAWMEETGTNLTAALSEAGAIVLDVNYADILLKGQQLRLGGYHGYYRQPGMMGISPEQHQNELAFTEDFESTELYKILMCHIPTPWLDWEYMDKHPVDLVLSGHYHGGQICLPLIGGVYAPYVGLFPQYTEGMYVGETATVILSTGLGSSPGIPRINNLPQIVVVDLIPKY